MTSALLTQEPAEWWLARGYRFAGLHCGIRSEREEFFLAGESVLQPPEFAAARRDEQIESALVPKLHRLRGWLGLPDSDIGQRCSRSWSPLRPGDVVVQAFEAIGWDWGGRWHDPTDTMHLTATGH